MVIFIKATENVSINEFVELSDDAYLVIKDHITFKKAKLNELYLLRLNKYFLLGLSLANCKKDKVVEIYVNYEDLRRLIFEAKF